jgi:hypothetical protein
VRTVYVQHTLIQLEVKVHLRRQGCNKRGSLELPEQGEYVALGQVEGVSDLSTVHGRSRVCITDCPLSDGARREATGAVR